jgi:hypothetical protein
MAMFQPENLQAHLTRISEKRSPVEDTLKRNIVRNALWLLGIPAIVYGAVDRGMVAFSTATVDVTNLSHCLIGLVLLLGWVGIGLAEEPTDPHSLKEEVTMANALLLPGDQGDCIAYQSYRLPFPYRCQIYHLLNLKHLEKVHRFSLGNLKVTQVSHFRKTQQGGQLRFKTVLDSPFNVLRMWRNRSVEVDLTIHSPHQIELKVPVYRQKFIRVLFSVIPVNRQEHYFFIHLFSNLAWPRELLKSVLLLASSLTLLEDLPYLQHLAHRNQATLSGPPKLSGPPNPRKPARPTMQLFHRYIDLYHGDWEAQQLP